MDELEVTEKNGVKSLEYYKVVDHEMDEKEKAFYVREGLRALGISNKYREQEKWIMRDQQGKYNTKEWGYDIDSNHVYIWDVRREEKGE
jgi:hypothetical protein